MCGRGRVDGSEYLQCVRFRFQVHFCEGSLRLPIRLKAVRLRAHQIHLDGILEVQRAGIRNFIQSVAVIHAEEVEHADETINTAKV